METHAEIHTIQFSQILDLSYNRIEAMQFGQFAGLSGLRFVDLSHNNLRSLARDAFQSTALESIDLSHNAFVAIPSSGIKNRLFLHIIIEAPCF